MNKVDLMKQILFYQRKAAAVTSSKPADDRPRHLDGSLKDPLDRLMESGADGKPLDMERGKSDLSYYAQHKAALLAATALYAQREADAVAADTQAHAMERRDRRKEREEAQREVEANKETARQQAIQDRVNSDWDGAA